MSIAVLCPKCQKKLTGPDSLAGRRAKCPRCGLVMQIPAAGPKPQPQLQQQPQPQEVFAEVGSTNPLGTQSSPDAASPTGTDGDQGFSGLFDEQQFDEMLADVGARVDRPHQSMQNRYPCPICHEMIIRGSKKCPFCGEDFEKEFNALLPNKGQPTGLHEFQIKMNTLGGIWIVLNIISLMVNFVMMTAAGCSDDPESNHSILYHIILMPVFLLWLALGIATLRKAMWAVWGGMTLGYLGLIGSLIYAFPHLICAFSFFKMLVLTFVLFPQFCIIKLAHRCIELNNQR